MKDAYYFPHFSNARHDRKLKRVHKELGIEGYAIYFMILEVLRDQESLSYPIEDIDLLADEFGTSEQKIKVVICNYKLFEVTEENYFFSPKQIEFLHPYFKQKEQRRIAGIASGKARSSKKLTTVEQPLNGNEQSKVKESKVKEIKEYNIIPPPFELVKKYCFERKNKVDPQKFIDHYKSNGWKVGKTKMVDWQAAVRTWEKNNETKKEEIKSSITLKK